MLTSLLHRRRLWTPGCLWSQLDNTKGTWKMGNGERWGETGMGNWHGNGKLRCWKRVSRATSPRRNEPIGYRK